MNTWVAFLRGINVGGKGMLPMKELTTILESLGAKHVRTYIQSGNAVFQSAEKKAESLAAKITAAIEKKKGFAPLVLVLDLPSLEKLVASNPFPEAESDEKGLHFGFLTAKPAKPDLEKLALLKAPSERYKLTDRVFYLHAPEGVGRSKLAAAAEKLFGVPMTDRNWRTVCAVLEMARGGDLK